MAQNKVDMEELTGRVHIRRMAVGSKSEGDYARFVMSAGEEYTLYREGIYPANDDYFKQFDGKEVVIVGNIEERTHYICVQSIVCKDNL